MIRALLCHSNCQTPAYTLVDMFGNDGHELAKKMVYRRN